MASNKILEPNTGHNPRTFGGSVHRLLATTAALATAGARRGWWKKARREVRAASEPAASVRGSFDFESESVQDAHDRVVAEDNIIQGDTTEAVAHLRHSHRSDTGSGAPNGLATTACTGCRVNGARKADIEKPMTQVPSGREGFHLLGVPDSWSPTVPLAEETDYSPFELRTWRDAELQAIYDRVPRHESLESSEAFYDYYLPRMDDSVRLYRTSQYRSGICQRYEWSAGSRSLNAVQALCAATHPELRPNATPTGFPEKLHVPGQLQLTPGVPLVVWSPEKEHLKFTQTVAVVHTPSTLDASPGTTMPTADIFKSIARNAMGNLDAADPRDRVPFYKLDGLRKNMRDKGAHASEFEGSYSLAWTSGEGQGAGNVQPAAQTDDPYVRERQRILVYDIGRLVPIALEASLSKLEYGLLEFRGLHGNVIGFGHETNFFATSLQMNISFIRSGAADGRSLIESLGSVTGCDHVDPHDCLCGYTVFLLLCSLPPGSDIGSFCFSECGAYAHSAEKLEGVRTEYGDVYVAVLVFKGRHLHGGLAPRAFWQQATSAEGTKEVGVRVGFVAYPNGPAVNRTGTMAVGPPNGFATSVHLEERRVHQRNILQAGLSVFGTRRNMVQWLAREYTFSSYNMYATAKGVMPFWLNVPFDVREALGRIMYTDEYGTVRRVSTAGILDPELDHDVFIRFCRLFAWLRQCATYSHLGITKGNVLQSRVDKARRNLEVPELDIGGMRVGPERRVLQVAKDQQIEQGWAVALEFEDAPGKLVWVELSKWEPSENKNECLRAYFANRWEGKYMQTIEQTWVGDDEEEALGQHEDGEDVAGDIIAEAEEAVEEGSNLPGDGRSDDADLDASDEETVPQELGTKSSEDLTVHMDDGVPAVETSQEAEDIEDSQPHDKVHADASSSGRTRPARKGKHISPDSEPTRPSARKRKRADVDSNNDGQDSAGSGARKRGRRESSPVREDEPKHDTTPKKRKRRACEDEGNTATRGSKRRREGQPEAPAMSTSKADAVESERERCGDDSERMTDSGVDAGEGDGGLAPESEIVVVVESAGQTEATAGDGVQLQKTGTKRRVTVHPPVPVTETLASIDWEREMSSLVTGRAFVQTGAPLKSTLLKSISRVQEFQRATAGGIAAHLTSGVAPHASMISIHVALDAAKDLSTMYALHHAGRMISSGSLLAMAHGYVRIMKWCLEDGPRFADWVFRDVLTEGSPRPVGVEWVDNLVKEVHRAVLQGATPRARRGKEKKGKKKDDEDEEEQSRWLMEDIEVPIMWLADRERALRSERGRGLGAEVEDGEESGNDDPNDDDYEPSSSDESSSDDDDTDFPTRDGTSSQPDDGAAVPRSSFAATIPLTRADGKPSGTAALVGKKVRVKTKTLTLEFGTYENSPVRRYQALTTALVDTLFEVLLAPGLRRVQPLLEMVIDRKSREKARVQEKQMVPEEDEGDPKEKAGKSKGKAGGTNGSAIQQHMAIAIARGWALEALREGAGTDIVWSSEAIASIWLFVHTYRKTWSHSPFRMIKPLRSAHRNAYQGRTGVVFPKDLAAFRSEIVSWFANNPSATAALQSYGEHYRYHLAELEGGSSEKFAATVPELFRKEERKHDGRGNGEATRSQRTSVRARKPRVGASPREITNLPSKQDWALPTLMLDLAWRREQRRLGEHDVLEDSVGAAETFFTGGDPHDRSASDKRTSDQMNPVLVFQETHKLLEKAIGKDQIRDPRYLKNLVLAIATGQSMRTRKFLEVWMDKMPRDAAEMAELYEERVRLNDVERAKYPVKDDDDPHSERWLAAHGDYWQLHDIAVYGAPSNAFSFDGGKAITRVFGDTLDRWLTGFLETHPDPGTQVSWEEMGKEISSWNIPPFTGDAGLGKLHLQHHLARRGLCRSATVPELGRWINVNRARGAFRGLTDLGFRPLLDENAVVHALQMTHDHLEVALPSQIRTAMDFGPALVENFLCKVHRTWGDLDTLKGAKGMSEKWVEGWLTEYFKHERIVDLRDWNGEQRLESCSVYG